jgi:protein-disulfide isomerase
MASTKKGKRPADTRPVGAGRRPAGSSKKRAKAARAVAAANQARSRRNAVIVTVVACVVIIGVVVGAVIYATHTTHEQQKTNAIKAFHVSANFPVRIDNGTILAGKNSAKVKIDLYEDFICPYCGQLEHSDGQAMLNDLNNGTLQIRYRIVDFLNDHSTPSGYSQRAANAAYASVAAGKFAQFHWSLYHDQAQEGTPGYSNDQLINLGKRLGITGSAYSRFVKQVKAGTYNSDTDAQANKLKTDTSLHQSDGSYGTPTLVHDGTLVDTNQSGWLDTLMNS